MDDDEDDKSAESPFHFFTLCTPVHGLRARGRPRARAKQFAFLNAYASAGIIGRACVAANVSRSTVISWRRNDSDFAKAFELAHMLSLTNAPNAAIDRLHFDNQGRARLAQRTDDRYVRRQLKRQAVAARLRKLNQERRGGEGSTDE
jgi:hypothetical protein